MNTPTLPSLREAILEEIAGQVERVYGKFVKKNGTVKIVVCLKKKKGKIHTTAILGN